MWHTEHCHYLYVAITTAKSAFHLLSQYLKIYSKYMTCTNDSTFIFPTKAVLYCSVKTIDLLQAKISAMQSLRSKHLTPACTPSMMSETKMLIRNNALRFQFFCVFDCKWQSITSAQEPPSCSWITCQVKSRLADVTRVLRTIRWAEWCNRNCSTGSAGCVPTALPRAALTVIAVAQAACPCSTESVMQESP